MPRLTAEQRKALDGESGVVVSPRELGIEPHTPMIESALDPGLCDYVASVTAPAGARAGRKGLVAAQTRGYVGWRCGLTKGHDDDHYLDRPPALELDDGESERGEEVAAEGEPSHNGPGHPTWPDAHGQHSSP